MRKLAYIASSAVLAGCGGGGGDTPSSQMAVTPVSQAKIVEQPYFIEVPNALKIENLYSNTVAKVAAVDISGDGRDDIVIHQIGFDTNNTFLGNVPCQNILKIYVMQPDNTFVDQTSSYIQGNDLGACSRKLRIYDINKDGRKDIVYAMNQEDGRQYVKRSDIDAQNVAIVSNGNIYSIKKFGTPNWYHSIGIGYDSNERPYVTAAGYTRKDSSNYYFDNKLTLSSTNYNNTNLSPGAFELFTLSKDKKHTNLLLQSSTTFPNWTSADGFVQDDSGTWRNIGSFSFAPIVSIAKGYSYSNQYSGDVPVFKYKDYHFTFAGMSESCKMRLTPDGDPVVVFSMGGAVVPDYNGTTIYQKDLKKIISIFKAATIVNNEVKEVPITFDNEQIEFNSDHFDCKDVNNDGYDDIIRYPFSKDGLPLIYINNKNNGFTYYGTDKLPKNSTGWEKAELRNASSLLHDFDKDGFLDLLVYAPHDVIDVKNLTYKFYRGNKSIQ
jgi:hypothetical protein